MFCYCATDSNIVFISWEVIEGPERIQTLINHKSYVTCGNIVVFMALIKNHFMLLVWWERIVGGRVFPSQVKAKERKMKKEEGGENNDKKNKKTPEQRWR